MQVQKIQNNNNTSFCMKKNKASVRKVLNNIGPMMDANFDKWQERDSFTYNTYKFLRIQWKDEQGNIRPELILQLRKNIQEWIDDYCRYTQKKGIKGSFELIKIKWIDEFGKLDPKIMYSKTYAATNKLNVCIRNLSDFLPHITDGSSKKPRYKNLNYGRKCR